MKAKIHTEIRCEECNGKLNSHKDEFIRCNTLKCSFRGKLFHVPVIELKPASKAKTKEVKNG